MQGGFTERLRAGIALSEVPGLEFDPARPWGSFAVLPPGAHRAKLLEFRGETSLHYHESKDEAYLIGFGKGELYRGTLEDSVEKTIAGLDRTLLRPGDALWIPRHVVHVVTSRFLLMVDAAYGDVPLESDVVRVYDKNGRADAIRGVTPLPAAFHGEQLQGKSIRSLTYLLRPNP